MLAFIYTCILALNIVAVLLAYHFLGKDIDTKTKVIYIAVGVAVIYMLVTFVYWVSTKDIDLGKSADSCKNLITFTFVPVNAIMILPFLSTSYKNLKAGVLASDAFRNRCILLAIILIVILIIEFFYFKDIQNGILAILQAQK